MMTNPNCINKLLNPFAVENNYLQEDNLIFEQNNQTHLRLTHRKNIPTDEIIYLESEVNYTQVYTSDNQKHISSFSLKILEQRITQNLFLRISKSYLVNPKYVKLMRGMKRDCQVILVNNIILSVSRRKFNEVRERLHYAYE
jgi:DNA-binding LytR/AlgR family response regulator